ncbi:MAG: hypothetical protein HP021_07870 [Lachnospira sp.]|nr:hypothetical protein [Lachnospira sp.]
MNNKRLCDRHSQAHFKYHDNSGSEVINMNVICTINDKKKNESGMAAMGNVKKQ